MFCRNCGKDLNDNAAFCNYCGVPVEKQNQQAPVSNTPPSNSVPQEFINPLSGANSGNMNQQPPSYNQEANAAPKKKKKGKAGKIILIILIILLLLALLPVVIIGIVLIVGLIINYTSGTPNTEVDIGIPEETTVELHIDSEIPEILLSDPLYYFGTEFEKNYKVTNNPGADNRVFSEIASEYSFFAYLPADTIVRVYGIFDGWALIEYPNTERGIAWVKAECLFETDEVLITDPNDIENPLTYFADYPRAYYKVTGTGNAGLNLRDMPNTDSEVITVLQESELIIVCGIMGEWAYVKTEDARTGNNYYGWCVTKYINFYQDI